MAPMTLLAVPVLLVGLLPECLACCIQVACATTHTSIESSMRLRLLKPEGFPVLEANDCLDQNNSKNT